MKCKTCGNTKRFTMLKETGHWNDDKKEFEPITQSDEYFVCDDCMNNHKEGFVDAEGDL